MPTDGPRSRGWLLCQFIFRLSVWRIYLTSAQPITDLHTHSRPGLTQGPVPTCQLQGENLVGWHAVRRHLLSWQPWEEQLGRPYLGWRGRRWVAVTCYADPLFEWVRTHEACEHLWLCHWWMAGIFMAVSLWLNIMRTTEFMLGQHLTLTCFSSTYAFNKWFITYFHVVVSVYKKCIFNMQHYI